MYRFDWHTIPLKLLGLGAFHSIELAFVFEAIDKPESKRLTLLSSKAAARALSERVHQAWIQFAKTGDPNLPGENQWPAYTLEQRATRVFNKKDQTVLDPDGSQRKAWDGVL
jgi:para-nitrobenzyl esterase